MGKPPDTELFPLCPVTVITGHYGVGKTNLSLNIALDAAAGGVKPVLVDLDVVNPYFRSSDHTHMLEEAGVRVVAPEFAGTTLDSPGLSGRIYTVLEAASGDEPVIVDAGGDDVGATALGRFAKAIEAHPYRLYYVVNSMRNLSVTPGEAAAFLPQIEETSHLHATGLIGNTHLQHETTCELIEGSVDFARDTAHLLGLPLTCITVPAALIDGKDAHLELGASPPTLYPVQIHVLPPWEE